MHGTLEGVHPLLDDALTVALDGHPCGERLDDLGEQLGGSAARKVTDADPNVFSRSQAEQTSVDRVALAVVLNTGQIQDDGGDNDGQSSHGDHPASTCDRGRSRSAADRVHVGRDGMRWVIIVMTSSCGCGRVEGGGRVL